MKNRPGDASINRLIKDLRYVQLQTEQLLYKEAEAEQRLRLSEMLNHIGKGLAEAVGIREQLRRQRPPCGSSTDSEMSA